MEQISDTDSDDDEVVGYLAGRSRETQSAAKTKDNVEAPVVSCQESFGIPYNLIHPPEHRGTRPPAEEEAEAAS